MGRTLVLVLVATFGSSALAQNYRFEAEGGQRFGGVVQSSSVSGFSGTGYLTNFTTSSDYFLINATVPAGLYEMWVGYRSQFGQKGYRYRVGNEYGNGMFDLATTFSVDRAGLFNLSSAPTTLGIYKDWGYHDVDYLELRAFTPPTIQPVAPQLVDSLANHNTQLLMNYLTSLYGHKTLAGHQHSESKNLAFPSSTYLNLSGGLKPAIRSSDFIEYSPSRIAFGANPNNESEQSIAWAKENNGIISMTWHWNAPANLVNTPCGGSCGASDYPWWRGFYTQGTTFNLTGALANPTSSDYQLLLRDIDAIGVQLKKFQGAGVPVIWRPLHEAQGGWFWWGAHGPSTFKQLWQLTYDRLTNHHQLHNLIWEFTSSAADGNWLDWYPGDNYVDMIGLDIYTDPSSSMAGQWYDVLAEYNGRKMIALSESGTLPNAALLNTYNIGWSYFSLWKDGYLDDFTAQQVQALLNDGDILTLDELPTLPWSNSAPIPGDFNRNGVVDGADYVLWRKTNGQVGWGLAADGDLNGRIDAADYGLWRSRVGILTGEGSSTASSSIPESPTLMLLMLTTAGWGLFRGRATLGCI